MRLCLISREYPVHKKLNGSAFHPRADHGEWTVSAVQRIIRNEAYIGNVVQGKTKKRSYRSKEITQIPSDEWVRVEGMHEPLITREAWEKAQVRRCDNTRVSRQTHDLCPLTKKVVCSVCGETMKRRVSYNRKGGKMYYAMYCASVFNGRTSCSNNHSVSGKELEKACIESINGVIQSYCDSDEIVISDMQKDTLKQLTAQKNQIQQQYNKVQTRLDSLYTDKLDGIISADDYLRYKKKFSGDLEKFSAQLESIEKQITAAEERMADGEYRKNLIEKYSNLTELTFGVAEDFIESIYVGERGEDGEREIRINLKV